MTLRAIVVTWGVTTLIGMMHLAQYQHQPGVSRQAPTSWPPTTEITLAKDRFTLLMFAHPKCPCTGATLEELARLVADCQGRVEGHALFIKPAGATESVSWKATGLWRQAERIPGIQVSMDVDGHEARRFAAETSGQVLLFDPAGRLRFQGGITPSRGHCGDNAGRRAIADVIHRGNSEVERTRVFGCDLGTGEVAVQWCQG